ncbi:MAG: PAP2 family protein, partial [Candidatus Competibacteraceae bacterium]|nr:PAP2 family protein [Candidatus Competibacteraceae bacterium]
MNTTERHLLILIVIFVGLGVLWLLALTLFRALIRALASQSLRRSGSLAWARTHPLRAWLKRHHPRLYRLMSRRLDPHSFIGLPLTLMVAAALYIGFLVAGLVEAVLEAEEMVRFDQRFNTLFESYREGVLVAFFTWVTELGSSAALLGIAVVSTGFVWAHGRGHLVLPLWVSYAGAHATTWAGKFVFARERPESVAGVEALSPSFPSAHATGAMAVYGFVAYAIARDLASFREH